MSGQRLAIERIIQMPLCNLEMGSAPDRTAVPEQNRLRRLVTNAETRGRLVGDVSVGLHGDELVCGTALRLLDVRMQFVEGFAADAAAPAVFEEENRPFGGLRNGGVEFVNT